MTRGVVFFDVDGTLVPRTSSGQHLADRLGHSEILRAAEAAYAAGTMTNQEVSVIDARGWTGRTPHEVLGFLDSMPVVDGIPETVAWCRSRDLTPVLATLAWDIVGGYLCDRFGFARTSGPRLEVDGDRFAFTGAVAAHFDELDKRDYARSVAADLGVSLHNCAAIGDSRSDLPLFAEVGLAIAFNASPAARESAHTTAGGHDLRVVLPLLETWSR